MIGCTHDKDATSTLGNRSVNKDLHFGAILLLSVGIFGGCSESQPPETPALSCTSLAAATSRARHAVPVATASGTNDTVLVLPAGNEILFVGVTEQRVIRRLPNVPWFRSAYGVSPDRATVYLIGYDPGPKELLAIDLPSMAIVWREPLTGIAQRSRVGQITVFGTQGENGIAVSPMGDRLFISGAQRDSVFGTVVLDAATRDPVGFVEHVEVLTTLAPSPAAPEGVVVGIGQEAVGQPLTLFLLDVAGAGILDSIALPPEVGEDCCPRLIASPSGRAVYLVGSNQVVGDNQLRRFDLASRKIVAAAQLPGRPPSGASVAPGGEVVYAWSRDQLSANPPGSGFLYLFDDCLQPLDSIDLRADDVVPAFNWAGLSPNGVTIYGVSGTGRIGTRYATQPGRFLVIDLSAREPVESIDLDAWLPRWLVVR